MTTPTVSTEPLHIETRKIADRKGEPPWIEALLADERSSLALKGDLPGGQGGSVDDHVHYDFIEWWISAGERADFRDGRLPAADREKA